MVGKLPSFIFASHSGSGKSERAFRLEFINLRFMAVGSAIRIVPFVADFFF